MNYMKGIFGSLVEFIRMRFCGGFQSCATKTKQKRPLHHHPSPRHRHYHDGVGGQDEEEEEEEEEEAEMKEDKWEWDESHTDLEGSAQTLSGHPTMTDDGRPLNGHVNGAGDHVMMTDSHVNGAGDHVMMVAAAAVTEGRVVDGVVVAGEEGRVVSGRVVDDEVAAGVANDPAGVVDGVVAEAGRVVKYHVGEDRFTTDHMTDDEVAEGRVVKNHMPAGEMAAAVVVGHGLLDQDENAHHVTPGDGAKKKKQQMKKYMRASSSTAAATLPSPHHTLRHSLSHSPSHLHPPAHQRPSPSSPSSCLPRAPPRHLPPLPPQSTAEEEEMEEARDQMEGSKCIEANANLG